MNANFYKPIIIVNKLYSPYFNKVRYLEQLLHYLYKYKTALVGNNDKWQMVIKRYG